MELHSQRSPPASQLREAKTVLLTTYKRDGSPLATPVSIAFHGDRAFFRTWHKAWKTKRLAGNPDVKVAPCTLRGEPTGPELSGQAKLLHGQDASLAAQALARGHPVLQRLLVPMTHRLMRYRTMHYELLCHGGSEPSGAGIFRRRAVTTNRDRSLLGRIAVSSSQFANRHGLYLGPRSASLHVALYRCTGGKLGGHLPGLPVARILLLDHTGANSGVRRTSPVMYHADGDVVAVMASKGGQATHPAWFHNLRANPDTTIQIGPEVRAVRARVATDEERDRLWPEFLAFYPGYDFFQRLAKGRKIPIVILEPR